MLNNKKENLEKFDAKANEGIFLDYSTHNKVYRVFKKRTLVVDESGHVTFDEHNSTSKKIISGEIDEVEQNLEKLDIQPSLMDNIHNEDEAQETPLDKQNIDESLPREWKFVHNHPTEQILGPSQGVRTCSCLKNICDHFAFLPQIEPKCFEDAENDKFWINAMQEELNQFDQMRYGTLFLNLETTLLLEPNGCL